MDLKTILVIISLVIGALLVVGPYLSSLVNTVKQELDQKNSVSPKPAPAPEAADDLSCLINLVNGVEDKEVKDYLVDKVAPQIIRQKLK